MLVCYIFESFDHKIPDLLVIFLYSEVPHYHLFVINFMSLEEIFFSFCNSRLIY